MIRTTNGNVESPTLPGLDYQFSALGTWNGATVTLQTYVDGAWRNVPDGSWTEDFEIVRTNGAGSDARLVVSGAGGATSLALNIAEVTPQ